MRIALVLDDTLDTPDGVQQYVLAIGGYLSERGHEVHYIVGHTVRSDIPNLHSLSRNKRVTFNGNSMSMPLPVSRRKLRRFLSDYHFDVVHVQTPYSPFLAGRLIGLLPADTAVVGTFHVLPYDALSRTANRLLALATSRSRQRFNAMIAATRPAADFARAVYGFRSVVIPHPFTLSNFRVPAAHSAPVNVVYLGRLVERKGASYLLQAVAGLHRAGKLDKAVKVMIGGRGPLLTQLERIVTDNGLSGIVSFKGFIAEDAKGAFLAQADIAVFPSTSGESFGISLIEGLAAARGVVLAGDNPGYRAVVRDPATLVDPKDTAAFSALLEKWIHDATARTQAAAAQREYVEKFDIGVIGQRVEAIYEQALQSRHKA